MIEGSALLSLLVTVVIVGLIFWLLLWFVDWVGVPEPFLKVVRVLIGLAALIYLINLLMKISGTPLFR